MDFIRIVKIIKIIRRRFHLSELFHTHSLFTKGDGDILEKTMLLSFLLLCPVLVSFTGVLSCYSVGAGKRVCRKTKQDKATLRGQGDEDLLLVKRKASLKGIILLRIWENSKVEKAMTLCAAYIIQGVSMSPRPLPLRHKGGTDPLIPYKHPLATLSH